MNPMRGLAEALHRIDCLDIREARRTALEQAAARIEAAVKLSLSHRPGEDHASPWLRMGELRGGIAHQSDDDAAVIGSSDPIAIYQELGTPSVPPRPFLSSTAAAEAEGIVHEIADTIRAAIEASR
ncbi:MAG: hypothetical protein ABI369_13725 [Acetobacteraceae bacterium]